MTPPIDHIQSVLFATVSDTIGPCRTVVSGLKSGLESDPTCDLTGAVSRAIFEIAAAVGVCEKAMRDAATAVLGVAETTRASLDRLPPDLREFVLGMYQKEVAAAMKAKERGPAKILLFRKLGEGKN